MDHDQLIKELKDFLQARGRFKVVNQYVGMAVSQKYRVFASYFDSLDMADRKKMALLIVAGTLGQEKALTRYVARCKDLMHYLCLANSSSFFEGGRADLEKEFNEPANIERWIEAQDQMFLKEGPAYKRDWHYPLSLWSILFLLKSDKIEGTYNYLVSHARSQEFKQALRPSVRVASTKRKVPRFLSASQRPFAANPV